MSTVISMSPDRDLDLPVYSIKVTWVWPENWLMDWTRFRIVRRAHAPAERCEEGVVVFETTPDVWGEPVFEDLSPPPNTWVYYTAFVLNEHRIWMRAGSAYEIGVGDHDWTINMPELLPGVSISKARQVVAKADPDHELVEFLQPPAMFLDRVKSLGEAMQYFWDPERVPPGLLPALLDSLGLTFDKTISEARLRTVATVLVQDHPHGTVPSIERFAAAATGYAARAQVSNNKMLTVLDSSFEWVATAAGTPDPLAASRWEPKDDLTLEIKPYTAGQNTHLPAEVLDGHYLEIKKAVTLTYADPSGLNAGDEPAQDMIPISAWKEARGGIFAKSAGGGHLVMGLHLYDLDGHTLLRSVVLIDTALTGTWTYYTTPFDEPVPLNDTANDLVLSTVVGNWDAGWTGFAQPQTPPIAITTTNDPTPSFIFNWNHDPDPAGDITNQPTEARYAMPVSNLSPNPLLFRATMAGSGHPDRAAGTITTPWRLVINWGDGPGGAKNYAEHSEWIMPSVDTETVEVGWLPQATKAWFGIEVMSPEVFRNSYARLLKENASYDAVLAAFASYQAVLNAPAHGGWATAQVEHLLLNAEVLSGTNGRAWWAIPYITVSDSTDIDLVVVDDG